MKRGRSVIRIIALIVVIGVGSVLTDIVSASSGCVKKQGNRCVYNACGSIPVGCEKWCTTQYFQGFGECVQGLSEEECTETQVVAFTIWYYSGTCNGGTCVYDPRTTGWYTGMISTDTSPCGGY